MPTSEHLHRRLRTIVTAAVLAGVPFVSSAPPGPHPLLLDDDLPGSALPVTGKPMPGAIEATFRARSYRAGEVAALTVVTRERWLRLRVFRAGTGRDRVLQGSPIGRPVRVALAARTQIAVGSWPSGLYYVRLDGPHGHVGYAPFVVRPRRLGEHRIAV